LARRAQALKAEIAELDAVLNPIVVKTAPGLVARPGVGPETAGAILVAVGDNPERMRSEASFAHLCGVAPIEASSGRVVRHRLNRGGDRQANNALWRIVFVRMRFDPKTRDYVERRTKEGLSRKEIMRCLKRFVAREVYRCIVNDQPARAAPTNADNDRTARPHGRHRRPPAIIGACGARSPRTPAPSPSQASLDNRSFKEISRRECPLRARGQPMTPQTPRKTGPRTGTGPRTYCPSRSATTPLRAWSALGARIQLKGAAAK
jgi:hypothetical protein